MQLIILICFENFHFDMFYGYDGGGASSYFLYVVLAMQSIPEIRFTAVPVQLASQLRYVDIQIWFTLFSQPSDISNALVSVRPVQ